MSNPGLAFITFGLESQDLGTSLTIGCLFFDSAKLVLKAAGIEVEECAWQRAAMGGHWIVASVPDVFAAMTAWQEHFAAGPLFNVMAIGYFDQAEGYVRDFHAAPGMRPLAEIITEFREPATPV